jgi:hypothetical protein
LLERLNSNEVSSTRAAKKLNFGMASERLPPLAALRAFLAAARLGSYAAAADELALTPGAISHQMKALEAMLGVALFRRSGHRMQLTPAGAGNPAGGAPASAWRRRAAR